MYIIWCGGNIKYSLGGRGVQLLFGLWLVRVKVQGSRTVAGTGTVQFVQVQAQGSRTTVMKNIHIFLKR